MIWIYDAIASIRDFIELGGDVLYAIMLTLVLMWTLILERLWFFYRVHPLEVKDTIEAWETRADTASWYAKRIRDQLVSQTNVALKRNLGVVKALIAICPLLGLMGTVTGMVSVFDVMTFSGTGNARAMAAGVSKATVPTMAGMVAALSGLMFSVQIEKFVQNEQSRVADSLTLEPR
jgi:biopolymer transport protein ExbB